MSNVKKFNRWTMDKVYKKILDMTGLKANEIKFKVTYEGHPKYSKHFFKNILRFFDYHPIWSQNLPHYVWASLDVLYLGRVNKLNRITIQSQSEPFWNFCMIEESVRSRCESISTNVNKPLGTQKIWCIELYKIHSHTLFATFCWNCLNM